MQLRRNASRFYFLGSTCLLSLLFSSCALLVGGGEEPANHSHSYTVAAPSAWKTIPNDDADKAYQLASGNIVTLDSNCNKDTRVSLELMTRHLLIGVRNINIVKREYYTVDGTEGLFSDVEATLDGKAFFLNLFVLPKKTCIFDFSLVSPKKVPPGDAGQLMQFVKSFQYGKN